MDEQATPRPFKGTKYVWPRPWKAHRRLFADASFGFALPGGVTTAEARLIVEAVNAYDRLRRIEAAARDLRVQRFGRDSSEEAMEPVWDVLRAALDSTP